MFYNRIKVYICLLLWIQLLLIKGSPTTHMPVFPGARYNHEHTKQRNIRPLVNSNGTQYKSENNALRNLDLNSQIHNKSDVARDLKTRSAEEEDDYLNISNLFKDLLGYPEEPNRIARSFNNDITNDEIVQDGVRVNKKKSIQVEDISPDKTSQVGNIDESNSGITENKSESVGGRGMDRIEDKTNAKELKNQNTNTESNHFKYSESNDVLENVRPSKRKKRNTKSLKNASASKSSRKVRSRFNKNHSKAFRRSHHANPKVVIKEILNRMQIPTEDPLTSQQLNYKDTTTQSAVSSGSVGNFKDMNSGNLVSYSTTEFNEITRNSSKLRSVNQHKFEDGNTNVEDIESTKDISKRQKPLHHSPKLRQKVKVVDEYHLKEKNIFIEPEIEPQPTEKSSKSTILPSENLSSPTQRTQVYYTSTYPTLSTILSTASPKTTSSINRKFSATKHALKNMYTSSTNLEYQPSFENPSTESFLNANSSNKDDALVIVLRLPKLILREISKVVTYGLEQNEKKTNDVLREKIPLELSLGKMSGNRKEKKDSEESLPTEKPYHLSTESGILHTAYSKNLTDGNSPNNEKNNIMSNLEPLTGTVSNKFSTLKPPDNVSYTKAREVGKDNLNISKKSTDDVHISTPTYTIVPAKGDSSSLYNNNRDFIESLIKEASSFQDFSNESMKQNKNRQTVGHNADPVIDNTTENPDDREQRAAYEAEIKVFKDLMAGLIRSFEKRIKNHPSFNSDERNKAIAYMKSLLPVIVSKHMEELVKEIHRTVEGRSKRAKISV